MDATLSFTFSDGADITWLTATSEGRPVQLANPMTVKSYTTLVFAAADGYTLDGLSCETAGVTVAKDADTYVVTISSASVTAAVISVTMGEMQASRGQFHSRPQR